MSHDTEEGENLRLFRFPFAASFFFFCITRKRFPFLPIWLQGGVQKLSGWRDWTLVSCWLSTLWAWHSSGPLCPSRRGKNEPLAADPWSWQQWGGRDGGPTPRVTWLRRSGPLGWGFLPTASPAAEAQPTGQRRGRPPRSRWPWEPRRGSGSEAGSHCACLTTSQGRLPLTGLLSVRAAGLPLNPFTALWHKRYDPHFTDG